MRVRRKISRLLATLFVLGQLSCGGSNSSSQPPMLPLHVGCYHHSYSGASSSQFGCGLVYTLGNPMIDQQSQEEYAIQSAFWQGVPAQVFAFDECTWQARNALSHPDGFILFGTFLTQATVLQTGSTLPLAGILAHEWAHQVQFRHGWMAPAGSMVRDTELEADAFSGFYLAIAKHWAGSELSTYFQILFSLGDYNFHSPQHHGTPNMRVAAGALGMMLGDQVLRTQVPMTYGQLHNEFLLGIQDIVQCDGFCADPLPSAKRGTRLLAPEYFELAQAIGRGEMAVEELELSVPPSVSGPHLFPVP